VCVLLFAVDSQYSSELDMPTSHAGDVVRPAAIICNSLDRVPTVAAGPGSGSGCYDNGAVGGVAGAVTAVHSGVTAPDPWCPRGRSGMAGTKLVDTWSSEDLAELFSRIGLGKYTDIFQQQEVC